MVEGASVLLLVLGLAVGPEPARWFTAIAIRSAVPAGMLLVGVRVRSEVTMLEGPAAIVAPPPVAKKRTPPR